MEIFTTLGILALPQLRMITVQAAFHSFSYSIYTRLQFHRSPLRGAKSVYKKQTNICYL